MTSLVPRSGAAIGSRRRPWSSGRPGRSGCTIGSGTPWTTTGHPAGGWSASRRERAVSFAAVNIDEIRPRVAADMPWTVADLERLVRIPSKGYPGDDPANVRASAVATRDILAAAGFSD